VKSDSVTVSRYPHLKLSFDASLSPFLAFWWASQAVY
jgi:hypothetical protein